MEENIIEINKTTQKVCICAIAKMENNCIEEWVEHYKNIGVDKSVFKYASDVAWEKSKEIIKKFNK